MLQKYAFLVAATAAAAVLALGGCRPVLKDARFTSYALVPRKQEGLALVADLEVTSTQKVIGVAKGKVSPNAPTMIDTLRAEALEAALASDPSGPDVLVADSWHEVRVGKEDVTVTVIGYPARYRNFRRDTASVYRKQPFAVQQLPDGMTVVSYDKNRFKAELTGDNVLEIKAIHGSGADGQAKAKPAAAPSATVLPAETNGAAAVGGATTTTTENAGE